MVMKQLQNAVRSRENLFWIMVLEFSACLALAFNSTLRQNTTGEGSGGGTAIYPMAARKQGLGRKRGAVGAGKSTSCEGLRILIHMEN